MSPRGIFNKTHPSLWKDEGNVQSMPAQRVGEFLSRGREGKVCHDELQKSLRHWKDFSPYKFLRGRAISVQCDSME